MSTHARSAFNATLDGAALGLATIAAGMLAWWWWMSPFLGVSSLVRFLCSTRGIVGACPPNAHRCHQSRSFPSPSSKKHSLSGRACG
jgi:hypothetical protein